MNSTLGPIRLVAGVTRLNASVYMLLALTGMMLNTFVSIVQPYILNVNLQLPIPEQGQVSGDMVLYGEIVILLLSAFIGVMADRFGRRGVFATGFIVMAVGYTIYGFVETVSDLAAVRIFLAISIAVINVMISTVQADYPEEESRGKLVGLTGFMIGCGAVLIGVGLARLPYWFVGSGASELLAGQLTMYCMSVAALCMAVVSWFGLSRKSWAPSGEAPGLREKLTTGLQIARRNGRIALAYGCAFVSRGDLVVVGTFFVLWANQAGVQAGMSPGEASKTAGGLFGLIMGSALLWAPVAGWLSDKLDRVSAMALAMGLCAAGYGAIGFVSDPLGTAMYPAGILLGIGQMSAITASQTLIGQEAPAENRGTVIGLFSFFGAAGVMFITSIGGRLYDAIDPTAPFVLIAVVNAVLFICALLLRGKP